MPRTTRTSKVAATTQVREIVLPPEDGGGSGDTLALETIAKEKAESKAQIVVQSDPEPTPVPVAQPPAQPSAEHLEAMIQAKVAAHLQQIEEAARKEREAAEFERLKAENEALKQAVELAKQQEANLQSVTGIQGLPPAGASQNYNPNSLAQFTSRTDYQPPLVKELFEYIQSVPHYTKNYEDQIFSQPDGRAVDTYLAQHIAESRSKTGRAFNTIHDLPLLPLFQEMEKWAKNQGLFRGTGAPVPVTQAGVVIDDMVGGFLPTLSSMLRYTHRGNYVFWQFPNVALDPGRNRGDTIQIARYKLNAEPANDSDWLLSGGGAFADITSATQNTQTGVVESVVKEYGMGKDGVAANAPYFTSNFVQMYSMLSVIESFSVNIMRNYMQFEDRYIRALWAPTSRKVYNNADKVELTATNLTTGSDATLTAEFLHSLYTYMAAAYIPTYMDGCYGLVVNSYQLQQLRKSMTPVERDGFTKPSNAADLASIVNMLPAITDIDRVTGYRGKWSNFHIFEQNTFGMGAAGTPGAQNVTLVPAVVGPPAVDAVTALFRTAYAFGANTIGRGIGMAMELRSQSGEILWNRGQKWIWISHESFTALDVDPTGYSDTSDVPQQLRVIEVRTTDNPL